VVEVKGGKFEYGEIMLISKIRAKLAHFIKSRIEKLPFKWEGFRVPVRAKKVMGIPDY